MTTNEVQLIYNYLAQMEKRMEGRLYTVESRLNGRLDDLGTRVTGLEQQTQNIVLMLTDHIGQPHIQPLTPESAI